MKRILILFIIFILFFGIIQPCHSFGIKKNYKERFLNQALNAEKHKNFESAFFNFEKLLFYYPKDETVLREYAKFCERNKFNEKALEIYARLFEITRKKNYLKKIEIYQNKRIKESKKREPSKLTQKPQKTAGSKTLSKSIPKIKMQSVTQEDLMYRALEKKDFDTAEKYLDEFLKKNPNNMTYTKLRADVALEKNDYENAIIYLEKLVLNEKTAESLAHCYFQLKDYDNSIKIAKKPLLFDINPEKWLKYIGDLYSMQNNYTKAIESYQKLIKIAPKSEYYFKLADFYLAQNDYNNALKQIEIIYTKGNKTPEITQKYLHILITQQKLDEALKIAKENNLLESEAGLKLQADLAYRDKNFALSREFYAKILEKDQYNVYAQRGIVNSHVADANNLKILAELKKLPQNEETKLLEAKTYYDMEMYGNSDKILKEIKLDEAYDLRNVIKRQSAYIFNPNYTLFTQKLSEEFKLNVNKIGFRTSKYVDNLNYYTDYNMIIYSSGNFDYQGYPKQNNFTNEIRGGVEGRINEKWAIKTDIGVKVFQHYGAMINTDSWIKYYVNDNLNLKLGFRRDNVEQSYLSAVGLNIDGKFTGQVADNKVYFEYDSKLPKRFYTFGRGGYGVMAGQNLDNNQYWEGMLGLGKMLYYNHEKALIKKISADIVSYNAGYQQNYLKIYDSKGQLFGGYWSPEWFSANTVNLNLQGEYKRLKYGIGTFQGWQYSMRPDQSNYIWGANVFATCKINEYTDFGVQYRYFNYADVQRNQFIVNLIFRGFRHVKKS